METCKLLGVFQVLTQTYLVCPFRIARSPQRLVLGWGVRMQGIVVLVFVGGCRHVGAEALSECKQSLLCDDFERGEPGDPPAGPWLVSTERARVELREGRSHSGSQAVHMITEGGEGSYRRAFISITGAPLFPLEGKAMWGRMMVWLDRVPEGSVHWTQIEGAGPVPDAGYRALYRYGGMHDGRLMANYETEGVASDCWQNGQTPMPTQRWVCMQWRFDGATDAMELWLDGAPVEGVSVKGSGQGCIEQTDGGIKLEKRQQEHRWRRHAIGQQPKEQLPVAQKTIPRKYIGRR